MPISIYRAWHRETTYRTLLLLGAAALGLAVVRQNWLVLAGLLGLCLVSLWPVQASLGVFALLVPFDSVLSLASGEHGITLTFVIGAASILVLVGTGLVFQRFENPPKPVTWWMLFVFWASLSALWAYNQATVVERFPTMFSLFVLYAIASCYRMQETEFRGLVNMTILGACPAALIAFYQFYHGHVYQDMRGSLIIGSRQTDPNFFAASLLLPLSLAVGEFLVTTTLFRRMLLLLAAGAIALGIFVTMSRGALLALAAMVIVYLVKLRMSWRIFVPVTVLLTGLLFSPKLLFKRVEKAEATGGAGRVYIWQAGVAAFKDHSLIGVGLDNFSDIHYKYAGAARKFVGVHREPHNIYLQTGVELGVVGLSLLMFAIVSQLRMLNPWRGARAMIAPAMRVTACQAAAWGMLIASFFVGTLWIKAFWLVWIMRNLASQKRMAESTSSEFALSRHSVAGQP
jgi:O-antigen ligase